MLPSNRFSGHHWTWKSNIELHFMRFCHGDAFLNGIRTKRLGKPQSPGIDDREVTNQSANKVICEVKSCDVVTSHTPPWTSARGATRCQPVSVFPFSNNVTQSLSSDVNCKSANIAYAILFSICPRHRRLRKRFLQHWHLDLWPASSILFPLRFKNLSL